MQTLTDKLDVISVLVMRSIQRSILLMLLPMKSIEVLGFSNLIVEGFRDFSIIFDDA